MGLNAQVKIVNEAKGKSFPGQFVYVPITLNKVEPNKDSIYDYVCFDLEDMLGMSFCHDDINIVNIDEIIDSFDDDEQ